MAALAERDGRSERFQLIEQRRAWAEQLQAAATNAWLKEYVRLADRYLATARTWLKQPPQAEPDDERVLRMADASIGFATERLAHIEQLLIKLGPNATWID